MKSFKQLWLSVAREVLVVTKEGEVPRFYTTAEGAHVDLKHGICRMTFSLAEFMRSPRCPLEWLSTAFHKWPKFSGSPHYPVPGYALYSPSEAFENAAHKEMWSPFHPYGALRRELLEFLIQEMEKEDEAKWVVGGVDVHP